MDDLLPIMVVMAIENEEDHSFVENLYTRYEKQMYVIAYSILHHKQDSEDCVHEAVLSIINCLDSFRHLDEERKLKHLVMIAAKNKAIDLYRKKKRQHEAEASMAMEIDGDLLERDVVDADADVVRMVINKENRRLVATLVRNLDDIYRDVLLLKFEQEMSNKEIAQFLDITPDLVRMRYMRAKRLLIKMGGDALYEASKT